MNVTSTNFPTGLDAAAVPSDDEIFSWVEQICRKGVRRPGYAADTWVEKYAVDLFTSLGMEVGREPVHVRRWDPIVWWLRATTSSGETTELECHPVPLCASGDIRGELAAFDHMRPEAVEGRASLYDVNLLSVPPAMYAAFGSVPADLSGRVIDPDGTFDNELQMLPFSADLHRMVEPTIEAGGAAFIGNLANYPGGSCRYYVPYDNIERPIPGVWVGRAAGAWLHEKLAEGPVSIHLHVETRISDATSWTIVGELPGPDDEVVMIGSHHDGPWSSAVEDASGVALVFAQAKFWASQPAERRPHRMQFVLQAGHMYDGAGLRAYIKAHGEELPNIVLEVHLEHAALDFEERDGHVVSKGQCAPRWWFVSRNPHLEAAVCEALATERLNRSMVLAPDSIGAHPTTDGGFYHLEGVPVCQFLAAPFYLFDAIDTPDKIDRDNLANLTRATIRIVDSTQGVSAAEMRAGIVTPAT